MAYTKRLDGRGFEETRKIEAKAGVIPRADGSAWFKIGKTEAIAAVYGPRDMFPRFMQDKTKGTLRCNYNMMPFSGKGDRVRPGANRRAKEISYVTELAISPVLDLTDFPNAVVDVFIEFPQTDAGSRCAGISAAAMALADAGIMMKDIPCSIAVGIIDGQVVVDLNYDEEAFDGEVADIPVTMIPSTKEISLLQMDGIATKEKIIEALNKAKDAMENISKIQHEALKEKYEVLKNVDEQ
jgi:exosome complex component RRP41